MARRVTLVLAGIAAVLGLAAVAVYYQNQAYLKAITKTMKTRVVADFRDPDSARFRNVRLHYYGGDFAERVSQLVRPSDKRQFGERLEALFTYYEVGFEICGEVDMAAQKVAADFFGKFTAVLQERFPAEAAAVQPEQIPMAGQSLWSRLVAWLRRVFI